MLKKIKKIIKDKKGAINTIEIMGWVAVVSIVLVIVVTALKPRITGKDGIMDNSMDRIEELENVMIP